MSGELIEGFVPPLCVLTVNTTDQGGGAEAVAVGLARGYSEMGLRSYMAVGFRRQELPGVIELSDYTPSGFFKFVKRCIAKPVRGLHFELGHEDFDYPGTWNLLSLAPERPDILHLHNLHGGYFDLRALTMLSRAVPTMLTLHDAWMLSGHCAHSFACDRWQTGCGACPDLQLPPRVKRDGTRYNWKRKQRVYRHSRFYVATPSSWLMSKVKDSMLAPAIMEARVIPNGIDTAVFRPGERDKARAELCIPQQASVILFAGNRIRQNPWKDYSTLRRAFEVLSQRRPNSHMLLLGLGEEAPAEQFGMSEIRFIPHQSESAVARYCQAADLYVHAARADTFPTAVIEALACGLPVVATAVGGIPEQIKSLRISTSTAGGYSREQATGLLVPPNDAEAFAAAAEYLLFDDDLRAELSRNAARDARARFDRRRQVRSYLEWYSDIQRRVTSPGSMPMTTGCDSQAVGR